MSLELYFHPFAAFCQKVLIALYENDIPFEPYVVDLGDERSKAALTKIWPIGKFPVLRDVARARTIPESSMIIEYLARHYPGKTELVPEDADIAWETRLRDRFYDLYVAVPMQKIVTDRIRPAGASDPHGVAEARQTLRIAYGLIDREMATRTWAIGKAFSMADCAAAPALYYANLVMPLGDAHGNAAAYLARLMERPSFARVVEEARPYRALFPGERMAAKAESTTTRLIRAPRAKVYDAVADIRALARCLQPEGTSSRILGYDHVSGRLRMEISHGPAPDDTRRFHLVILETRKDEAVVYRAEFETDDALLAGEMKLHFALKDAPGGTEVTVRHEGIPARVSVEDNERGTESSLGNLARLIEGADA